MKNKLKFGDMLVLTKKQSDRFHFSEIPVGTRAVVIDLDKGVISKGYYDATVVFEGFKQVIKDKKGCPQNYESGYIEKGTYKKL